ncbi:MAG: DUF4830 domain-containing protein [Candidatus Fimivivens sp.]
MFMYAFRFNRRVRRSALLLFLLLAVMAAGRLVLNLVPEGNAALTGATIKRQDGKTEEQRQEFLTTLGWVVNPEPDEVVEIIIPKKFDEVYENYNNIQKEQGMDLSRYKGKRCKRYSYTVLNYPGGEQNIRLNILVCKNKIIGGEVSSMGLDGFMHGLIFPAQSATPQTSEPVTGT